MDTSATEENQPDYPIEQKIQLLNPNCALEIKFSQETADLNPLIC